MYIYICTCICIYVCDLLLISSSLTLSCSGPALSVASFLRLNNIIILVLVDGTVVAWGNADMGGSNLPLQLTNPSTAGVRRIYSANYAMSASNADSHVYACPKGHAGAIFGMCAPCSAGKYAPHADMYECLSCAAGTYSVQNVNRISKIQALQLAISDKITYEIDHPFPGDGRGLSEYYAALIPENKRYYSSVLDNAPAGMW